MRDTQTFARVRRIIAANREIAEHEVSRDARLTEDLNIDSLAATEILFDIEDEFGIVVPEQQSISFSTVADLCDAVDKLLAPQ
jgi:acyl carrier protein